MTKLSRWWGIVIGTGVALSPIHNRWLTDLATNDKGEVIIFLPAIGYVIFLMASGIFFTWNWNGEMRDRVRSIWRDWKITIPLLVIVISVGLSDVPQMSLAPLFTMTMFSVIYAASRLIGKDIEAPLAIGALIASIGVIIQAIVLRPGRITGGLVFEHNYDAVVGYILLGVALYQGRWRLPLITAALVAMFLTGSPEALFVIGVTGSFIAVTYTVTRNWTRKTVSTALITIAPTILVASLWFGLGFAHELWGYAGRISAGELTIPKEYLEPLGSNETSNLNPLTYRREVIRQETTKTRPFGEGFTLTVFNKRTVHNVPLIIVQQAGYGGALAALAWLWISGYCLIKSRRRYLWILMLALSTFDHFTWTQLAPYWWVAVGASQTTEASQAGGGSNGTPNRDSVPNL